MSWTFSKPKNQAQAKIQYLEADIMQLTGTIANLQNRVGRLENLLCLHSASVEAVAAGIVAAQKRAGEKAHEHHSTQENFDE
jgi:hypothetical protein